MFDRGMKRGVKCVFGLLGGCGCLRGRLVGFGGCCWVNLWVSAAAWFDVFLDGCTLFQIKLLLPRVFFGVLWWVLMVDVRCSVIWSCMDWTFKWRSWFCLLAHSAIRPVSVGCDTDGSF